MPKNMRLLCVGAGLYNLTLSRLLVESIAQLEVTIIDQRSHIGGNAYSYQDSETGVEVHKYGSHIFHTNRKDIVDFLSRFSDFVPYEHHVWTQNEGKLLPLPIGLATLSALSGRVHSPESMTAFISDELAKLPSGHRDKDSLESKAISLVGPSLYEATIRGYTRKQWQTNPYDLPSEIITRLPFRTTLDTRYFSDRYQLMPAQGYGAMLNNIADHPRIEFVPNTPFGEHSGQYDLISYTGAIDEYFDYRFGELRWRTLDFAFETIAKPDYQGTAVMNFNSEKVPFTRVHEFKHFPSTNVVSTTKTIIAKEFSRWAAREDEKYYPVNLESDRSKLKRYRAAARNEPHVHFGGRLGTYKYLDMHMAVGSAMAKAKGGFWK